MDREPRNFLNLELPKTDYDLVNNGAYYDHGMHPFGLFGRCDHTACGKPAEVYILFVSKLAPAVNPRKREKRIASRCLNCLSLVQTQEEVAQVISEDEVKAFLLLQV